MYPTRDADCVECQFAPLMADCGIQCTGTMADMLELSRGLLVTPAVKQIQRKFVLGIDDPHKEEAI